MHLRGEAPDAAAACMFNQSLEERSAHTPVSPGVLYKQFDEIHRFPAIFGSPFVAGISESAENPFVFSDKNYPEFRRFKNALIHTLSIACCRASIPLMQQFFCELAHARHVLCLCGSDLNCGCLRCSHLAAIVELESDLGNCDFVHQLKNSGSLSLAKAKTGGADHGWSSVPPLPGLGEYGFCFEQRSAV